jgi:hypothetical protein|tara:strand:+ start:51 stop:332 length:282 start_codon:yes stop_codon:yes gene_type:complete
LAKKKPTKAELWNSIQTIARECVQLRERIMNMEHLFDMLLDFKKINKEFIMYVEDKIKENADAAKEVQETVRKDNAGSNADEGRGAEGVRQNA